jgi:hypothetical protein
MDTIAEYMAYGKSRQEDGSRHYGAYTCHYILSQERSTNKQTAQPKWAIRDYELVERGGIYPDLRIKLSECESRMLGCCVGG